MLKHKNIKSVFVIEGIIFLFLTFVYASDLNSSVIWAGKVIGASSEMSGVQYSANQALGKPSIMPSFGKSPASWMPDFRLPGRGSWIHLAFDTLIHAKQIIINENFHPGGITNILFFNENGDKFDIYTNSVPDFGSGSIDYFRLSFPLTEYNVASVQIFLKANPIFDGQQIDAVGISSSDEKYLPFVFTGKSDNFFYKAENLGNMINSEIPDLAPLISPDGNTLFFTRDRHPENIGIEKKQDIWISVKDNAGNFQKSKNIGFPINTGANNFALSISPDGNTLVVGNVYMPDGSMRKGISYSLKLGNDWTLPKKINIKNFYNHNVSTGGFYLTNSGKVLLMSVQRDDSYGGLDLYASFLVDSNDFTEPVNLGPGINTASDEDSPFLASDNETLYFSTGGFPGYGSNDMFIARKLDESMTKWTQPENMGQGINTNGWDAFYTIPASGEFAYFVSDKNSLGMDDIFRIRLPEWAKPKAVMLVSGKVYNAKTKKPIGAKIIYETLPEGIELGVANSNSESGDYKIVLPSGKKYGFLAESDGFIAVNEHLDLTNFASYGEVQKDLFLVPIEEGQRVRLNNIFFDFDKFELLPDSYIELNRLVSFLEGNSQISIEIQGHTDNFGSAEYNKKLSYDRANAVSQYLISKNISTERLNVKGFGKEKPLVKNDTEENRRLNRRVEFVIKGKKD